MAPDTPTTVSGGADAQSVNAPVLRVDEVGPPTLWVSCRDVRHDSAYAPCRASATASGTTSGPSSRQLRGPDRGPGGARQVVDLLDLGRRPPGRRRRPRPARRSTTACRPAAPPRSAPRPGAGRRRRRPSSGPSQEPIATPTRRAPEPRRAAGPPGEPQPSAGRRSTAATARHARPGGARVARDGTPRAGPGRSATPGAPRRDGRRPPATSSARRGGPAGRASRPRTAPRIRSDHHQPGPPRRLDLLVEIQDRLLHEPHDPSSVLSSEHRSNACSIRTAVRCLPQATDESDTDTSRLRTCV